MAKKLTRAVRAVAWFAAVVDRWVVATDLKYTRRIAPNAQDCMVVPLAEYERLTRKSVKAAKRGRRGK